VKDYLLHMRWSGEHISPRAVGTIAEVKKSAIEGCVFEIFEFREISANCSH
jgi:hypothetical protein